jgi:NADH-quinone oxidoreductase subunit C
MSKKVIERLKATFGDRILETSDFRGDDEAVVAAKDWREVATFLRDDGQLLMDHFVDMTAVDFPLREDQGRFDVLLFVRSMKFNHRVRIKVRLLEDQPLISLLPVWAGANWAEREIFDMFGIKFTEHPDLRRILMYEEFEGFPLRKDYAITHVQPLVAYREVEGTEKLPPFGDDEGMPFGRTSWTDRMAGHDFPVSTGIGVSVGARKNLSQGAEYAAPPKTSSSDE